VTLIKLCRELYFSTLLSTLAVPDMMESHGAIARSYEEVLKQATDSWT
jgi:chlorite dismutase